MISWKYSFETALKELEIVRKKKQALDSLFNTGKISASTYEHLNKEITNAITAIEADQKALTEKMTLRAGELESQIKSLEMFLANLEIHHAAGELDEDAYRHQSDAITLGLETTKHELTDIKEALVRLIPQKTVTEQPQPEPVEQISETEQAEEMIEKRIEASTETPVETPVPAPTEEQIEPQEIPTEAPTEEAQETVEATPETIPE